MPVVVAVWPNNTLSVLQVPINFSMIDLFWEIDAESDPTDAVLYLLKPRGGWSHLAFNWNRGVLMDEESECLSVPMNSLDEMAHEGRAKRLPWPENIVEDAYRAAFPALRSDGEKP